MDGTLLISISSLLIALMGLIFTTAFSTRKDRRESIKADEKNVIALTELSTKLSIMSDNMAKVDGKLSAIQSGISEGQVKSAQLEQRVVSLEKEVFKKGERL